MSLSIQVPFNDLRHRFQREPAAYLEAVERVLSRGWYVLGPEVEAFEAEFAQFQGGGQAIGVANGTDAIELALRAGGIQSGDEVLTVAHTAVATACGIERSGAIPKFVDIEPEHYSIDPQAVEAAITPRTRAVVAVHLYGQPVRLQELRRICDRAGLLFVEDCAQAHGASEAGKLVGTVGDIAAFSCYPTKNLGAFGDAGVVFTRNTDLARRARQLRNYGQTNRYHHELRGGFNSRLDELQAAILRVGLRDLEESNHERQLQAQMYLDHLALDHLPHPREQTNHVYHLFVVRHLERDRLQDALRVRGIETLVHYPIPVHLQGAYAHLGYRMGDLPVTERIARQIISLPLYPGMSDVKQEAVIEAVRDWVMEQREVPRKRLKPDTLLAGEAG